MGCLRSLGFSANQFYNLSFLFSFAFVFCNRILRRYHHFSLSAISSVEETEVAIRYDDLSVIIDIS